MYYVMDSRIVPQMHLADYWILKPPCAHKKRVPHEYIAYLIQKGELYLAEDGITYHLHPGDFILLDPDKYHEGKQITKLVCLDVFILLFHLEITPQNIFCCEEISLVHISLLNSKTWQVITIHNKNTRLIKVL